MLEAAQVRTEVALDDVVLVERTTSLLHVRAFVRRTKSRLADGEAPATDALQLDLVERVVPRSPSCPDALEIVDLRVAPQSSGPPTGARHDHPRP